MRSERSYVAGLYARLDAERARVKGEYNAALRGTGGTPMERDVRVRDDSQSAVRVEEQWAAQDAAPSEWELCTPDADRSAAQSCVVRVELVVVAPVGRHGSWKPRIEAQYSVVVQAEHRPVQREQQALAELQEAA